MHDLFLTEAWPVLSVIEGDYSNDPNDTGGETFRGIARKKNPNWVGWTRVDALRSDPAFPGTALADAGLNQMVVDFYRAEFWTRVGADDMPPALALDVFDCGVNCGQGAAVKMLQRVLNVMNKGGVLYADISADGQWGPGSRAALDGYLRTRGDLSLLIVAFNCLQGAHYVECAERREANETYAFGWFKNRIDVKPTRALT